MKDTPKTATGELDIAAEWECEQCRRSVVLGDTHLSWCLQIICADCADRETASMQEAAQ